MLVLAGARFAYRTDLSGDSDKFWEVNNRLTNIVESCRYIKALKWYGDTLFVIKENKELVFGAALDVSIDGLDFTTGKILGYPYHGFRWNSGDRYLIRYTALTEIRVSSNVVILYEFVISIDQYDDDVARLVLKNREMHNEILRIFGYHVGIECFEICGEGSSKK